MALAVAMSKAFKAQEAGNTKGIFVCFPAMATELHFPNLIPEAPPEEAHPGGIGGVLLSLRSGSLGRIFPSLTGGLFSGNTSLARRRAASVRCPGRCGAWRGVIPMTVTLRTSSHSPQALFLRRARPGPAH